jgi:hypothetical protein
VISHLLWLPRLDHQPFGHRKKNNPATHDGAVPSADDVLISRKWLCTRWQCSDETLRRRERAGLLNPIHLSNRLVRYRLAEVMAVEKDA